MASAPASPMTASPALSNTVSGTIPPSSEAPPAPFHRGARLPALSHPPPRLRLSHPPAGVQRLEQPCLLPRQRRDEGRLAGTASSRLCRLLGLRLGLGLGGSIEGLLLSLQESQLTSRLPRATFLQPPYCPRPCLANMESLRKGCYFWRAAL